MFSKEQKIILETIFDSPLNKIAAWGGGTALSEIYLKHRQSEDIDIILDNLPPEIELTILTNRIKDKLKDSKKKSLVKMNRFQYVFEFENKKEQKLEFIYYPFIKLKPLKKLGKIKIESLLDIAVSKTLSAYQRKEIKDAFDLFVIFKENHFDLKELIRGVKKKFEEEIDAPTLLARLTKSLENFDSLTPLIIGKKYQQKELINFFQEEFNKFLRQKDL
ncbi:nucleotidyl transferase AbiEii/AbiGii toxin family protein [Patescibacteria group bacterium]|nr:nucleotidyl transferase AbiEii/AbiGii toxin family protein [Patescibacteria group bacterium]